MKIKEMSRKIIESGVKLVCKSFRINDLRMKIGLSLPNSPISSYFHSNSSNTFLSSYHRTTTLLSLPLISLILHTFSFSYDFISYSSSLLFSTLPLPFLSSIMSTIGFGY